MWLDSPKGVAKMLGTVVLLAAAWKLFLIVYQAVIEYLVTWFPGMTVVVVIGGACALLYYGTRDDKKEEKK